MTIFQVKKIQNIFCFVWCIWKFKIRIKANRALHFIILVFILNLGIQVRLPLNYIFVVWPQNAKTRLLFNMWSWNAKQILYSTL